MDNVAKRPNIYLCSEEQNNNQNRDTICNGTVYFQQSQNQADLKRETGHNLNS